MEGEEYQFVGNFMHPVYYLFVQFIYDFRYKVALNLHMKKCSSSSGKSGMI